jgi:hypothetical protein
MSLISSSTIFYINSDNRASGSSNDFLYQMQVPLQGKYDNVCVLQMSIPKSYYIVQSGEYFTLNENVSNVNITLPVGNYTRKCFSTVVQGLLNTSSPHAYTYAITYPTSATAADTGLFTFTVTGNGAIQPRFIFLTTNDLNTHMGFATGSTNTFVANSLVSTQVINMQAENCLYLHSDICTNGDDDVLQEVFSNGTSDFAAITFQQQCIDGYSKQITNNSNNVYRFNLTDENNIPINLNGQNFNFTLLMYKKNDIYEMLKQYIKLKELRSTSTREGFTPT